MLPPASRHTRSQTSRKLPNVEREPRYGRADSNRSLEASGGELVGHLPRQIDHQRYQQIDDGAGADARREARTNQRAGKDPNYQRPSDIEPQVATSVIDQ